MFDKRKRIWCDGIVFVFDIGNAFKLPGILFFFYGEHNTYTQFVPTTERHKDYRAYFQLWSKYIWNRIGKNAVKIKGGFINRNTRCQHKATSCKLFFVIVNVNNGFCTLFNKVIFNYIIIAGFEAQFFICFEKTLFDNIVTFCTAVAQATFQLFQ